MQGDRDKKRQFSNWTVPTAAPESSVSRRSFLGVVGVGAAGAVIGHPSLSASPSVAPAQGTWRHEADIVVVGSGAAGSSAALNAHRLGNQVLVLEKAASHGGTTRKSGGDYWIPNNRAMRAMGLQDSREDALRYMARVAFPHLYNPGDRHLGISVNEYELLGAFYDNAAPAVDAIESVSPLKSKVVLTIDSKPQVDYRAELPEDKGILGRSLGTRSTLGGGKGAELIAQLHEGMVQQEIPLLLEHRATRLVLDEAGGIAGLEVTTPDGSTVAVRARKAVIFCSGGFAHNRELRRNFLRGPIFGSCTVATNEGDFIYIATAVGARLGNMTNAWWAEVVLETALDPSSTPMALFSLRGDSMIAVNRYGRRIVGEKINYNDRGQIHFVWDPWRAEYPNLLTFMIYDQRTADRFAGTFPIPTRGGTASYVLSGHTLEELARSLEARLEKLAEFTGNVTLDAGFGRQLEQTVARFNQFAERGVDEDFHRGETLYEVTHRSEADVADKSKPNPFMFPISATGPYYAIILAGGALDTHSGPMINARAQVLDSGGKPIPRLYGAGNCIAFAGQAYFGLGSTIGPAFTFGYIAAREASNETRSGT